MVKWRSDEEELAAWPETVEAWRLNLLACDDGRCVRVSEIVKYLPSKTSAMSYRDDGDSASTTHSGPDSQMSKKNRVQAVSVGRDQLPAAPR